MGFGKEFHFGNRYTKESLISLTQAGEGDVAWASVGQYETLVNPYHMLTLLGAVANDGNAVLPFAVSSVTTPTGKEVQKNTAQTEGYLTAEISNKIKEMMRKTVENNYGDYNFQGLSMCGKTGTAEVDDKNEPHSWFVGFSQNEKCPVAIVVVVENGGWGSSAALPIASGVMKEIYKSLS
jgi:peptidoglycan glycosyltransferase